MVNLKELTKVTRHTGSQKFNSFEELYKFLLMDFKNFLTYCCHIHGFKVSKLQLARADAIQSGQGTLLITTFRGSGKSFDIDCYIIWRLLRVPNTKILLLGAKDDNAARHVRRICKIIKQLPVTKWIKFSKTTATGFQLSHASIEDTLSFQVAGLFSSIEGSRADVIILDDCEVRRNSETPALRNKLLQRFSEVQAILHPIDPYRHGSKIQGPEKTLAVYIGTPQTEFTTYKVSDEEQHPLKDAFTFVVPALVDGESTFPERFSTLQLHTKKRQMSAPEWALQMMLNPELLDKEKGVFDVDKLPRVVGVKTKERVLTFDPAGDLGNGKDEAGICVAGILTSQTGKIGINYLSGCRLKGNEVANELIRIAKLYTVEKIVVEGNLNGWFSLISRLVEQEGCFCQVTRITSNTNKFRALVETLDAPMNAGLITFESEILNDKITVGQFKNFTYNPKSLSNDDRLDVLRFAVNNFADHLHYGTDFIPDYKTHIIGEESETVNW